MENIIRGNKFSGEDESTYEFYQEQDDDNTVEEDDNNLYEDVEDSSDFEYKPDQENLYRYFKNEANILEPERTIIRFVKFSNKETYTGKVLKEIDRDHFIFLIEKPEKKMMKIDINDISLI